MGFFLCETVGAKPDFIRGKQQMHYMELNIEKIDSFRFTLPVHFIGMDGDQAIQVTVEYGDSLKKKVVLPLMYGAVSRAPGSGGS